MSEITLETTHALLEKLAEYVMSEGPRKSEIMTKKESENRFQEVNNRFQQIENELTRKADKADLMDVKEDLNTLKENVRMTTNEKWDIIQIIQSDEKLSLIEGG